MVNRVSSYFPKGGHSATQTELKIIWTHVRWNVTNTLTPKTGNREAQQNYRLGTVSYELLGGGGLKLILRAQPHHQFLKWYKTLSWLFGSHDNLLTRQWIIEVNRRKSSGLNSWRDSWPNNNTGNLKQKKIICWAPRKRAPVPTN